jgi:hypothetical protein
MLRCLNYEMVLMATVTHTKNVAAGCAALAICESLLLALTELKVLDDSDARGVLEDAAAAHRDAESDAPDAAVHNEAAQMIERILSIRNALPRR